MKRLVITQEEKKLILEKYHPKGLIYENKILKQLFGKVYDDIFRNFSDDVIRGFDDIFIKAFNQKNMMEQGGKLFLKSINPKTPPIPMDTIEEILLNVSKGRLKPEQVLKYLPDQLADGTKFRDVMQKLMASKGGQKTGQQIVQNVGRVLDSFKKKFVVKGCTNMNCPQLRTIVSDFQNKLPNSNLKFDPKQVKIVDGPYNLSGRETMVVEMPNGQRIIWNSSTGSNVKTTGKEKGTWSVIPGFGEDGWFIKTDPLIGLTRGGNKYLTDMANYLFKNGANSLGGHIDHAKIFK